MKKKRQRIDLLNPRLLSVHLALVEAHERLVVHKLNPRADCVKRRGSDSLLELSLPLPACDDIEANPKILELGELDERAVEIGGVFNLKEAVGEQPCLAPVEPNHIDRLGALAEGIVGKARKLLHGDLRSQRLSQKRLLRSGFGAKTS